MSLATLKKKTQTKYNNMSIERPNFSINGTLRNQGYVGQDSIGRSFNKTITRNNVPHGYGGCCSKFDTSKMLKPSSIFSLNDGNVIKGTVLSTNALFAKRANDKHDCIVVKADDGHNNGTQWEQMKKVKEKAIMQADDPDCNPHIDKPESCQNIFGRSRYRIFKGEKCDYKKNVNEFKKGLSYSVYIDKLTKNCFTRTGGYYTLKRAIQGYSTTC